MMCFSSGLSMMSIVPSLYVRTGQRVTDARQRVRDQKSFFNSDIPESERAEIIRSGNDADDYSAMEEALRSQAAKSGKMALGYRIRDEGYAILPGRRNSETNVAPPRYRAGKVRINRKWKKAEETFMAVDNIKKFYPPALKRSNGLDWEYDLMDSKTFGRVNNVWLPLNSRMNISYLTIFFRPKWHGTYKFRYHNGIKE